jgi:hypothetical protein
MIDLNTKKANDAESKFTFSTTNINFKKSDKSWKRNLNHKIWILSVASKSSSLSDDSLGHKEYSF